MASDSDYDISTDPLRFDLDAIHAYLTQSYWSPGIPRETVARAIENSLCFGAFHEGRQIGFARMITDRATFAYLADVYVLEAHRGKGVAKKLMNRILAHPDLQGLRRMMLATRDAHALYAQYGFTPLKAPDRMMEKHVPDVYRQAAPG
ncbi:MAG: GNAT family N-acetyltransferase [Betaproteobacteria bacterium]|nr:GNAT family N-acetyltransferase [Betaproteobacteria bacterium]